MQAFVDKSKENVYTDIVFTQTEPSENLGQQPLL